MKVRESSWTQRLRVRLRLNQGEMSVLGSERSFDMPVGANWSPDERPRGYYIDFRHKCESAAWPPFWFGMEPFYVADVQWGLGALEHYVSGDGEEWLQGAADCADYLISRQEREGPQEGGWRHEIPMPHSYHLEPPWLSSITQGEAASLLVRLHLQTGEERFADAARLALKPLQVPVSEGGMLSLIDGAPFLEEYPTAVPCGVLNGEIFALFGLYDVAVGLADEGAQAFFERCLDALAENIWRFDTGYWSRYDIYPHPIANVASPAYHALHIRQLEVLSRLAPRPELESARERFESYRASGLRRRRAFAQKVAFRLLVPRNELLGHRLPWNRSTRERRRSARRRARGRGSDVLVLSYHAVSPDWPAELSVTPERLSEQLELLVKRGYRGVTFGDAIHGKADGKVVAITFDDAYRSVFELAGPILERFGMPGTLFIPTQYIDQEEPMAWPGIDHWLGTEHEHELLPMSWQQARALADSGWELGSHTRTHPRLSKMKPDALEQELVGSRRDCERMTDCRCDSLAYPYGDYDDEVVAAARRAGYSGAATLPEDQPIPEPLAWPRVGIYFHDGSLAFRLKVSTSMRRLRGSSAWGPTAKLLRAVLGRVRR